MQSQCPALNDECKDDWSDLIQDVHNWGANGRAKHKIMCQKLCQTVFGEDVYFDQRNVMRAGLHYQDHNHHNAIKKLWIMNETLKVMIEGAIKLNNIKFCKEIVLVTSKPRARVN